MEKSLRRALRVYWNKHPNTNDELAAFAATLNPPLNMELGRDTTGMVHELIDHIDQHDIALIKATEGDGFIQQTNIVETGEPPEQGEQEVSAPEQTPPEDDAPVDEEQPAAEEAPPEDGEQPPEDQQLEGEGIPGPEEKQEQPARDGPYDFGGPDPALVGAGAPTPPEPALTPEERIEDMEELFDKFEQLLSLPPAHQNVITAEQRAQHDKGMALIAQGRLLLSDAE